MRGEEFLIQLWDDRLPPIAILRASRDQRPRASLPRVTFSSEDGFDDNGEFHRHRVVVACPTCGVGVKPLAAPLTTKYLDGGAGWVGLDSRSWWTDYLCRCRRGHPFVMHTFTTD